MIHNSFVKDDLDFTCEKKLCFFFFNPVSMTPMPSVLDTQYSIIYSIHATVRERSTLWHDANYNRNLINYRVIICWLTNNNGRLIQLRTEWRMKTSEGRNRGMPVIFG